jgi:hypothetical protein
LTILSAVTLGCAGFLGGVVSEVNFDLQIVVMDKVMKPSNNDIQAYKPGKKTFTAEKHGDSVGDLIAHDAQPVWQI